MVGNDSLHTSVFMEETGTLRLSALSSMDKTVSISKSLRAAFAFSGLKQYPPKINRERICQQKCTLLWVFNYSSLNSDLAHARRPLKQTGSEWSHYQFYGLCFMIIGLSSVFSLCYQPMHYPNHNSLPKVWICPFAVWLSINICTWILLNLLQLQARYRILCLICVQWKHLNSGIIVPNG